MPSGSVILEWVVSLSSVYAESTQPNGENCGG